ncbi:MAG: hypothetical protein ACRC8S_13550 [Fimbriiglobus sp.]
MRLFVAFVSMCFGGIVAFSDFLVDPPKPGANKDLIATFGSITWFGVAYPTAGLLYRYFGLQKEAAELANWSRAHMIVLQVLGGLTLVVHGVVQLNLNVLKPSFFVGLLMLGLAVADLRRKWLARRSTS